MRRRRDRKVRVAVDWTLDWFLRQDIVEINVRRTRAAPGAEPPDGRRDELVLE